jgi:aromatic ring hydroxylase
MTLQEAKDEVAKGYDFQNWEDMSESDSQWENNIEQMFGEAAELYTTSQIEEATRHYSETFKNMTERCNQYHAQIEDLTKENEELRKRCSLNYGGGFTEEEITINALKSSNDRYREALKTLYEGHLPIWANKTIESALHPLVKEGEKEEYVRIA